MATRLILASGSLVALVTCLLGCGSAATPIDAESKVHLRKFCGPGRATGDQGAAAVPELVINRTLFNPGRSAFVRVLNRGTNLIEFGLDPTVEVRRGRRWVELPLTRNGLPLVRSSVRFILGPHSGSECAEIPVSPNWSAGTYRATVNVETHHPKPGQVKAFNLRVRFRVVE